MSDPRGVFLSPWMLALLVAAGPPEPPGRTCLIQVQGVPEPQRSHHRVAWAGVWHPLRERVELPAPESEAMLRLEGPRYTATRTLHFDECDSKTLLTVIAKPLPAVLDLQCPPPETVLRCEDCEGEASKHWYQPDRFPPLAMKGASRTIVLLVKAVGYRDLRQKVALVPGRNTLRLELERLSSQ